MASYPSQRELQPIPVSISEEGGETPLQNEQAGGSMGSHQLPAGTPVVTGVPATQPPALASNDQLLHDISQFDNWESTDQSAVFRKLRRKVMYVSAATAVCIVISSMMNYLFQLDGQLEVMKIMQEADNKPVDQQMHVFAKIFIAGLPGLFIALTMGMCVPACGYFGAKNLNPHMLGCFSCQNFCAAMTMLAGSVMMVWAMASFIPGVDHWVQRCDPAAVCCDVLLDSNLLMGTTRICDAEGLPLASHKATYLDCILGGHPDYTPKFPDAPHLSGGGRENCVRAIPALTHCGDAFGMPPAQLEKELAQFKQKYPTTHSFYFAKKNGAVPAGKRYLHELFDLERSRDAAAFEKLHMAAPSGGASGARRELQQAPSARAVQDEALHSVLAKMRNARVHPVGAATEHGAGSTASEVVLSVPGEKGTITLPRPQGVEGNQVDVEKLVQGIFGAARDADGAGAVAERAQRVRERLPQGWEQKLHRYGGKLPTHVDVGRAKKDVDASLLNLTSADGNVQQHEAERLFHGGEKAWERLNDEEDRKPAHGSGGGRHHRDHHDGGIPTPKFEDCEINAEAVKIMHKVHEKLPELVPKVEMLIGMKLLITLPLVVLWLVASCWGCALWKSARAGYRPTFFNANLQQGLMSGAGGVGIAQQNAAAVVAPGVFVRPQDVSYSVSYPGVQQQAGPAAAAEEPPSAFTPVSVSANAAAA